MAMLLIYGDKKGAAKAAPMFEVSTARLLGESGKVINGRFDVRIREGAVAPFGRHRAFALERTRVESLHARLQTRRPSCLITGFWRACDACSMASDARCVIRGFPAFRCIAFCGSGSRRR